jgi:hypothetical protein
MSVEDRDKKPGQSALRGFYRLLPQLVGSFGPGGGVSGECAQVGPIDHNRICAPTLPDFA